MLIIAAVIIYINLPKQEQCQSNISFNACYADNRTRLEIDNPGEKITHMEINLGNRNLSLANIANGKTIYDFISADIYRIDILYEQQNCNKHEVVDVISCKKNQTFGISLESTTIKTTERNIKVLKTGSNLPGGSFISNCKSDWQCFDWGICQSGIQRRDCIDKNSCLVSSNTPNFEQTCNECKENWQCIWSNCENGETIPSCIELNSCNTEYSRPKSLPCINENCKPAITCGEWGQCNINYNIKNLDNAENFEGIMSRLCKDDNNCISPIYEYKQCSMNVDVYVKEANDYLEIYNKDNQLIGKVKYTNNYLDINFYT